MKHHNQATGHHANDVRAGGLLEDKQLEDRQTDPQAPCQGSTLVIFSSRSQQQAEEYCEALPLHLCHGCDGCGMRCTEGVRMTRTEYQRIEQFLTADPREADRVRMQDKSIPGWPVTLFCQFRDTEKDRCSIYPVRPVICRLFGHTEWLPCPLEIVPLKGQEAMDVYQQYAGEEIRPFDEWRQRLPVSSE